MAKNSVNNLSEEKKKSGIVSSLNASKEHINDELSVNLKYAKENNEEDKIAEDERKLTEEEDNFLDFLKQEFMRSVNQIIKGVQDIVGEPLTKAQVAYLRKIVTQDYFKNHGFELLTEFFKENGHLRVSFDDIIKLYRLKLTRKKLENLETLYQLCVCDVSEFVNYINNVEVLSDDIIAKLETLSQISSQYEANSWEEDMSKRGGLNLKNEELILLKKIDLSNELLEKINYLLANHVCITIKDIININKKGIDDSLKGKIEQLKDTTYLHRKFMSILKKQKITDKLLENISKINDLDIPVYIRNLPDLSKLDLTNEDIKKVKYVLEGSKHTFEYRAEDIFYIKSLTFEELKEIYDNAKKLGLEGFSKHALKVLHDIPEEAFNYCIKNEISNTADINKVRAMYSIGDRKSLKEYIQRKNTYLEENRLLSDEKFEEYFGGKGKFNKHEIYQGEIGLCYLYSGLEILKKMNGFDVLVQTNLKETDNGWIVRYPFFNGNWIKVNKEEIDKHFEITKKDGSVRDVNINSIGDYLGFKVLEIAYIKNRLLNIKQGGKKLKTGSGKVDNPYDIEINAKNITKAEGGDTILSLKELLSEESVLKGIIDSNHAISHVKRLEECRAPEILLSRAKKYEKEAENRIDKIFDLYGTGFITIELSVNPHDIPQGEGIRSMELNGITLLIDNVNILDKQGNEIAKENLHIPDAGYTKEGPKVEIYAKHAYSVEKCYTDKNGEKRVWVVNPWHTDIKFDMSLEQCKRIFVWEFGVINIDNLFRQ